jgi:hypothetical protein
MRIHRSAAWSVALAVGMAVTSCATLPTNGSVALHTLPGADGQAQHGVQVDPVPPRPGWSAAEVVYGFLAASAAFDNHQHAVARKYLTPRFNRKWSPGWAATIIDSPKVNPLQPPAKFSNPGPPTRVLELTGKRFATLQTPGQDQAGSVVMSPGVPKYRFLLVPRARGWRIDSNIDSNLKPVSPTLLMLTSTDFARDYLPRNLYFYSPRGDALVPDPVYIPQTSPESEVNGLVKALIHPRPPSSWPPPSSWLWHAATTAFPAGAKLIGAQVVGGIKAVIDLGGAAARADLDERERMAAQLYWSLTYSPYATQYASSIKSVVLEINNRPVKSPTTSASLLPRSPSSSLYYQAYSAQEPEVAALLVGSPTPVPLPLPAGLGNIAFTTMAVSTQPHVPPVIAGCAGRSLYLIKLTAAIQDAAKLSAAGKLTTVRKRLPAGCSSLSWDNSGNLWITAKSQALVLPTAGATTLSKAALVDVQVPQLSTANPPAIPTLRVAPDGVRVAMIVGAGHNKRILVAAISRNASFTFIGQIQQMLRVGSDIGNPVALTWLDPDHLLALSRSGTGRTQLFEVPLNGGESTEITIPVGVTSLAASWPNGPAPHVVIGIAPTVNSPGKIEMAKSGWPNPDWVPVAQGTSPVYPG